MKAGLMQWRKSFKSNFQRTRYCVTVMEVFLLIDWKAKIVLFTDLLANILTSKTSFYRARDWVKNITVLEFHQMSFSSTLNVPCLFPRTVK